ncbi:MAG: hypothetical protein KME64_20925 [Scytonematopsis contorta HA4267-MV1]|jgi:hypothetical protein|nr:hypothetical protein [Scytonematopsis contorta HA4267-MV1]
MVNSQSDSAYKVSTLSESFITDLSGSESTIIGGSGHGKGKGKFKFDLKIKIKGDFKDFPGKYHPDYDYPDYH